MAKDLKYTILLDIYAPLLTKAQRETLDLYYNEDLSLGEIAANWGVSRQSVMNSVRKGEQRLDMLEGELSIAARAAKANALLDRLAELADGAEAAGLIEKIRKLL